MISVRGHFEHLKKCLDPKTRTVVFCTIPFIPRIQLHKPDYGTRLGRLNRLLLKWSTEKNVYVLPLHLVMSVSPGLPDCHLYERFAKGTLHLHYLVITYRYLQAFFAHNNVPGLILYFLFNSSGKSSGKLHSVSRPFREEA